MYLRKYMAVLLVICLNINFTAAYTAGTKSELTEPEVSQFMDAFFSRNLDQYHVPGAAVVVVKDGVVLYKKAYGYSNLESKAAVNADQTKFPAGSVSKLFTATAVMQLYDKQKININEDVGRYLGSAMIQNPFREPVTFANLLTHSSGVDEASEFYPAIYAYQDMEGYRKFMEQNRPIVVRKPGTIIRYSNNGYNLLGYLIEKVSGKQYSQYIEDNIYKPLDMKDSLLKTDKNTAAPYSYENGIYTKGVMHEQMPVGAAGVNTTVMDMGKFMIAHLQKGRYENRCILSEEKAEIMQHEQFSNHESVPGMGYGFIQSRRNNQRIIKHEGGLMAGYTTSLFLLPDKNVGFYVATNSLNPLPFMLEDAFLDAFYPAKPAKLEQAPKGIKSKANRYTGTYRSYDGIAVSKLTKLAVLLDPAMDMKIWDNKDGTLSLEEYTQAREKISTRLVALSPSVFQREDQKGNIAFRFDKSGNYTYVFNDTAEMAYEKVKWYQSRLLNGILIGFALILFGINIVGTVLRAAWGGTRHRKLRRILWVTSGLNLSMFTGVFLLASYIIINGAVSWIGMLKAMLAVLSCSSVLGLFASFALIVKMRIDGVTGRPGWIYQLLSAASFAAFFWFINYWNVFGIKI